MLRSPVSAPHSDNDRADAEPAQVRPKTLGSAERAHPTRRLTPERLAAREAQSRIFGQALLVARVTHAQVAALLQVGTNLVDEWTSPTDTKAIGAADLHRLACHWPAFWHAYRELEDADVEPLSTPESVERLVSEGVVALGQLAETVTEASAPTSPGGVAWTPTEAVRVERCALRMIDGARRVFGVAHRAACGGGR